MIFWIFEMLKKNFSMIFWIFEMLKKIFFCIVVQMIKNDQWFKKKIFYDFLSS